MNPDVTYAGRRDAAYDHVERTVIDAVTNQRMPAARATAAYRSPTGWRLLVAYAERVSAHPSGQYSCTPPIVVNFDHDEWMRIHGLLMLMACGWRGEV